MAADFAANYRANLRNRTLNHAERLADLGKGGHSAIDLLRCVRSAHLGADARLAFRHHGVRKADYVDALRKQGVSHARGERGVAEHHRDDRVLTRYEVESERRHRAAEALAVFAYAASKRRAFSAGKKL